MNVLQKAATMSHQHPKEPSAAHSSDELQPGQPIPAYEPDDGPLTPEQVKAIQAIADQHAFEGPVLSRRSLFDMTAEEYALMRGETLDLDH